MGRLYFCMTKRCRDDSLCWLKDFLIEGSYEVDSVSSDGSPW